MPFTALGLGPNITKAVREAGYTEPTLHVHRIRHKELMGATA